MLRRSKRLLSRSRDRSSTESDDSDLFIPIPVQRRVRRSARANPNRQEVELDDESSSTPPPPPQLQNLLAMATNTNNGFEEDSSSDESSLIEIRNELENTGKWDNDLKTKWEAWEFRRARIIQFIRQEHELFLTLPHLHSEYEKEWVKFYNERSAQLKRDGIHPKNFDFTQEWSTVWLEKMREFSREKSRHQKAEIKRGLSVDKDSLMKLCRPSKSVERNAAGSTEHSENSNSVESPEHQQQEAGNYGQQQQQQQQDTGTGNGTPPENQYQYSSESPEIDVEYISEPGDEDEDQVIDDDGDDVVVIWTNLRNYNTQLERKSEEVQELLRMQLEAAAALRNRNVNLHQQYRELENQMAADRRALQERLEEFERERNSFKDAVTGLSLELERKNGSLEAIKNILAQDAAGAGI